MENFSHWLLNSLGLFLHRFLYLEQTALFLQLYFNNSKAMSGYIQSKRIAIQIQLVIFENFFSRNDFQIAGTAG